MTWHGGLKLNQAIKALFGGQSMDQGIDIRTAKINGSRTHSCNLTFDPLKIKQSRASEGNDQVIKRSSTLFADQKFDSSHKGLNRRHVSDYTPLPPTKK